jgi:hypothetical protein
VSDAEGAYDGVERAVRHRQVINVADAEVDARVQLPRSGDHARREVDAGDLRTATRCFARKGARTSGQIEQFHAGLQPDRVKQRRDFKRETGAKKSI